MPEEKVEVKKRRFLKRDYDYIANYVCEELKTRKSLQFRTDHESLWKEVDRQVRMKPMEVKASDPEDDWRSALEMGDMSTASEVLSADVLRLIFPQDRRSMETHSKIDWIRLQARSNVEITEEDKAKVQRKADSELRALMTQQWKDFGFRARVELSLKEALHHGSFVAEAEWEEIQQYAMGGAFKSNAAPVWVPHSMWNCYPETLELGVNMIYTGSMIIESEKDHDWVLRQTNFLKSGIKDFKDKTTNPKDPVRLITYHGNITVRRGGEDIYLPNMKIIVAESSKAVLYAMPNKTTKIIYAGYDRVDIRDPYYMSPLVKQSTNHRIVTIIANKFIDNVELKLEPPGVYDGNDPTLVAQGGPRMIPGEMTATKGGTQNFKQIDVGDPSWAGVAIEKFQSQIKEGTGVSSPRAGAQRQADRVTATQIEEESAGSQIRTIDFVGKVEKGIESFCYIQHDMNNLMLNKYEVFNSDMGMDDFITLKKEDLPDIAHFEMVGSKGVLSERRRAQETQAVMAFLLGNERTADMVKIEEMAKQMLLDAGNKNPEKMLNLSDANTEMQRRLQELQARMEEIINELKAKLQEVTQKLVQKEMELGLTEGRLQLRNERAEGTESHLRQQVRELKSTIERQEELTSQLLKMREETEKQEDLLKDIRHEREMMKAEMSSAESKIRAVGD